MSDASDFRESEQSDSGEPSRINKRDFIRKMAAVADLPLNVTAVAYDAFVATLLAEVRAGTQVNLTGFGKFYWQRHKGHPVKFADQVVDDYTVLRFSATRESNGFLDKDEIADGRVPGTRRTFKLHGNNGPAADGSASDDEELDEEV